VTRIELLFIYTIISHAMLDFGVKHVLRKFSSKVTRCTYNLRARDLTRNYVGKNFRRPHDKYQPKVRTSFIRRKHKNPMRHWWTITVRYLSSLTIALYFRYFSWHLRSNRARDLPFVINYEIPRARKERCMEKITNRFLKLAQWKSWVMNLGFVFMVHQ